MSSRHTISLDEGVYTYLKSKGKFGESFNSLVNRLIQTAENYSKNDVASGDQENELLKNQDSKN